jgi:hypothetical protein
MIGDDRTVPLVARDGSVDRLCRPDLDSPSRLTAPPSPARGRRLRSPARHPSKGEGRDITFLQTTLTRAGHCPGHGALALPNSELAPPRELGSTASRVRAAHAPAHHAAFGYAAVQRRLERRGGIPVTVAGPNALAARSWQAGEPGSPKGDLGALGGRATGKAPRQSVGR